MPCDRNSERLKDQRIIVNRGKPEEMSETYSWVGISTLSKALLEDGSEGKPSEMLGTVPKLDRSDHVDSLVLCRPKSKGISKAETGSCERSRSEARDGKRSSPGKVSEFEPLAMFGPGSEFGEPRSWRPIIQNKVRKLGAGASRWWYSYLHRNQNPTRRHSTQILRTAPYLHPLHPYL